MLSRIRNAIAVNKFEVSLPHSKIKEAVARLLKDSNFIDGVIVADATVGKTMTLRLNPENSNSRITEIKRVKQTRTPLLRQRQRNTGRYARSWYRDRFD